MGKSGPCLCNETMEFALEERKKKEPQPQGYWGVLNAGCVLSLLDATMLLDCRWGKKNNRPSSYCVVCDLRMECCGKHIHFTTDTDVSGIKSEKTEWKFLTCQLPQSTRWHTHTHTHWSGTISRQGYSNSWKKEQAQQSTQFSWMGTETTMKWVSIK